MKLYTEQQAIALTQAAYTAGQNHNAYIFVHQCSEITPIEIPSDDEMDNASLLIAFDRIEFIKGAKWMREKIKRCNK